MPKEHVDFFLSLCCNVEHACVMYIVYQTKKMECTAHDSSIKNDFQTKKTPILYAVNYYSHRTGCYSLDCVVVVTGTSGPLRTKGFTSTNRSLQHCDSLTGM